MLHLHGDTAKTTFLPVLSAVKTYVGVMSVVATLSGVWEANLRLGPGTWVRPSEDTPIAPDNGDMLQRELRPVYTPSSEPPAVQIAPSDCRTGQMGPPTTPICTQRLPQSGHGVVPGVLPPAVLRAVRAAPGKSTMPRVRRRGDDLGPGPPPSRKQRKKK